MPFIEIKMFHRRISIFDQFPMESRQVSKTTEPASLCVCLLNSPSGWCQGILGLQIPWLWGWWSAESWEGRILQFLASWQSQFPRHAGCKADSLPQSWGTMPWKVSTLLGFIPNFEILKSSTGKKNKNIFLHVALHFWTQTNSARECSFYTYIYKW